MDITEFNFAFPNEDDTFTVYSLIGWGVRERAIYNVKTGSCSCKMSSITSSPCIHKKTVDECYFTTIGRDSWVPDDEEEVKITKNSVIIRDKANNRSGVISPYIGDLKAISLFRLFSEGTCEATPPGDSILQPKRLRKQFEASYTKKINIGDSAVFDGILEIPYENYLEEHEASPKVLKEVSKDWMKVPKPDASQFYVSDEVWRAALFAIHEGENILLVGPSGSGKSELSYILADAMKVSISPFNMGAMSEPRSSLIGNTHLGKDGTWFEESRFVRAVKDEAPHVVLLDEITRSEKGAFNILMPLMDGQRYLSLDEAMDSPIIKRGEKVAFWATANIGMIYTGTMSLDKALKDRFPSIIEMHWPPREIEEKILHSRTGVSMRDAKRLVAIADQQRKMALTEEFEEEISTRMLLSAAKRVAAGIEFKEVCEFSILNHFSAEGGNVSARSKVRQIIQKK